MQFEDFSGFAPAASSALFLLCASLAMIVAMVSITQTAFRSLGDDSIPFDSSNLINVLKRVGILFSALIIIFTLLTSTP